MSIWRIPREFFFFGALDVIFRATRTAGMEHRKRRSAEELPTMLPGLIGGTHPAQGFKQIPLIRQVYAEAQRQLHIGDSVCDRC